MIDAGKICAVIVTWNAGSEFINNIDAVLPQVGRVIIIDNGSEIATRLMLDGILKKSPDKVDLICNARNMGIGAAQNQGITSALEMKFLTAGSLIKLRKFGRDKVVNDVQVVISSGSMIKRKVFENIGMLREDLFIDYVDTDFCLRMAESGWTIALVMDAVLYHNLGDLTSHKFAGRITGVTNHSSLRRFTIFRNRVRIWKRYFYVAPSYVLFDIAMGFYDLIKIALFETSRKEKLRSALKGLSAGACLAVNKK